MTASSITSPTCTDVHVYGRDLCVCNLTEKPNVWMRCAGDTPGSGNCQARKETGRWLQTPTCLEESERDEYGWPSMQPCGVDATVVRKRSGGSGWFSPGWKTLTPARALDDVELFREQAGYSFVRPCCAFSMLISWREGNEFAGLRWRKLLLSSWATGRLDTAGPMGMRIFLANDMSCTGATLEARLIVEPPFSLVSLLPAARPMGQRRCLLIFARDLVPRG